MAAGGSVSDPANITEAQDVWIDAALPNSTAVYYDRQVISDGTSDIWKYSSKNASYTLDPKSAVNFTRTNTTATSYNAGTVSTIKL